MTSTASAQSTSAHVSTAHPLNLVFTSGHRNIFPLDSTRRFWIEPANAPRLQHLYLLHHAGQWRAKFAPSLKQALHAARKHFKSNAVFAVLER